MKRLIILTVAIVLMFAMSASAFERGLTGYGMKFGMNMANFGGKDAKAEEGEDKKMKMGFAAGGFVTYSITEMFAVQPEVLYTMKGAKYEWEGGSATAKVDYLEIPVLAKVTIPTEGNIGPHLFIGPSLGILLSAKEKVEIDGEDPEGLAGEEDAKDWTKSTDFGLVFGAGVDIGMPHSAITIDGRFELGLSTIEKDYECTYSYDGETITETCEAGDVKNSVISFMVGYSF